jgi:hypothetical protein
MPGFAWREWATRAAAAALVLALLGGLVYWLRTPSASNVLSRANAVVTQSLDRLSALSPATLLAREGPAAEADAAGAGAEPPAATPDSVEAARAHKQAEEARRDVTPDVPRAASAHVPTPARVAAAVSRVNVMDVAPSPRLDDLRRAGPAAPSNGHTGGAASMTLSSVSTYSGGPNVPGAAMTLAPWSAERRPERLPFVEPGPAESSIATSMPGSEKRPASVQALRAATDTSTTWLARLWSGGSYVKTDRYADPFEEFQVCHVPGR